MATLVVNGVPHALAGQVQTVLGPIGAGAMGVTLPHEHLLIDFKVMFLEPAAASDKGLASTTRSARSSSPEAGRGAEIPLPGIVLDGGDRDLLREGGTRRREAVEGLVRSLGGRLEAFYYAFGETDVPLLRTVRERGCVLGPRTR